MENNPNTENESFDFVKIIVKQRILLLVVFLVVLCLGVTYILVSSKVYKVDSLIEIGKIPSSGEVTHIENPKQLIEKIEGGSYNAALIKNLDLNPKKSIVISAENPDNTDLLRVYMQSANTETDKKVLEELDNLIVAEHKKKFDAKMAIILDDIKNTQKEVYQLQSRGYSSTAGDALVTSLSLKQNQVADSFTSYVVKSPTVSLSPIKPRPLMVMLFSCFVGFCLALLVALGKEWWVRSLKR